jgi:hypothetical protein
VFSVPGYDMVLGMDWLESLPPMWVDWVKKTIKYKVHGQEVILKGIKTNLQQREPVSLVEL